VFGGKALRIGQVQGIEIAIDYSWVLIFLLITFSLSSRFGTTQPEWTGNERWAAALLASPLFFVSIILHELGHSLVAIRLDVPVRSITLFVFGGLARLEREPKRPRDEIAIAIAGPLVSLALGLGFLAASKQAALWGPPDSVIQEATSWLGTVNLFLAAFNMVPGFPLDGGRIFRGILWAATGSFKRATTVSAAVGTGFAFALIALGILSALTAGQWVSGLWICFIGWFLLTAARATMGDVLVKDALQNIEVHESMSSVEGACVGSKETIDDVIRELVLRSGQRTLYVVDDRGTFCGLVALRDLARVPPEQRALRSIDQVMTPADQLTTIGPHESIQNAFDKMARARVNQLPVVERGSLLGALHREQLIGLVHAHLALDRRQGN